MCHHLLAGTPYGYPARRKEGLPSIAYVRDHGLQPPITALMGFTPLGVFTSSAVGLSSFMRFIF